MHEISNKGEERHSQSSGMSLYSGILYAKEVLINARMGTNTADYRIY